MATTPNFGWTLPTVGGDADTWGTVLNTLLDAVDAQVKANLNAATYAAPTGMLAAFDLASAPTGWVAHNGLTIGDGSSNATGRANADCEALFTLIWNGFSNSLRPIYDSAGNVSSRGANAAADWAAHKALTLGNSTDCVLRSYKAGGNGPSIGATQEDAIQNITGTVGNILPTSSNGSIYAASGAFADSGTHDNVYSGAGAQTARVNFDASPVVRTATETRVKSHRALVCVKL